MASDAAKLQLGFEQAMWICIAHKRSARINIYIERDGALREIGYASAPVDSADGTVEGAKRSASHVHSFYGPCHVQQLSHVVTKCLLKSRVFTQKPSHSSEEHFFLHLTQSARSRSHVSEFCVVNFNYCHLNDAHNLFDNSHSLRLVCWDAVAQLQPKTHWLSSSRQTLYLGSGGF